MSNWKEYILGDIIDIKHGYAFKGEFFSETPTDNILLTPGNFKIGGGFKNDKLKYYYGEVPDNYVLKDGDIIVTMTDLSKKADTLGYSAKVPIYQKKVLLHNQRIGLLIFKENKFDRDFIYWLLRSEHYQKFVAGSATGATVKHTSPSKIKAFKFKAPVNNILRIKIAKILSNYDDLIENNLKQIDLLEESAKLTYEDCFLRFKIDGKSLDIDKITELPFGWKNKKLGDFFPITTGKKDANIQNIDGQYPFFTCSQETLRTDNYSFDAEAIILAGNGEFNVKYFRGKFEAYQRNYVLIPYNLDYLYILFLHIRHYLDLITYGSKGAVIKYLTKDMIEMADFLEPTEEILIDFNKKIIPIFHLVEILNSQNRLLKEAREILLPRLMTGMIDTSMLDITV
jgi:type I restriction enzyme S subunit